MRAARRWTNILTALLGATLLLAIAIPPVQAAEPAVTDLEIATPQRLTVGDRLRFIVTVEADSGSSVALAAGALPPIFSQTQRPALQSSDIGGGRSRYTLTIEAAPFVPGPIDIPPLAIRVEALDGSVATVETPPSAILVESVLPTSGGALTPRDLKPQAEIGTAPSWLLYEVLGGLLVALVVVLGLLLWRLRRPRLQPVAVPVEVAPAPLGPEDRARRVLDGGAEKLIGGDYVGYYTTLSAAVRNYLTERYGFPAFALTTTELQERMVRQGIDRWQARLVGGLLNQCDAVVYASYRPAHDRADADLTAAYEIIEMSRPAAEPEREEVPV